MYLFQPEYVACADCVAYLANGTVPAERPDLPRQIAQQWKNVPLTTTTIPAGGRASYLRGASAPAAWFSRQPCDCCCGRRAGLRAFLCISNEA